MHAGRFGRFAVTEGKAGCVGELGAASCVVLVGCGMSDFLCEQEHQQPIIE
jgi:hypothetical protein